MKNNGLPSRSHSGEDGQVDATSAQRSLRVMVNYKNLQVAEINLIPRA